MDNALSMIGLALRAGKLEVGEDPAGDACRDKRCRLLLLAADAAEGSQRKAMHFAEEGHCILLEIPYAKAELGGALGRSACAMAAVTDLGLAQAIVEKLAPSAPEKYGEIAERLRLKAQRAAQRREKTALERRQNGGKRPSASHKKKPFRKK